MPKLLVSPDVANPVRCMMSVRFEDRDRGTTPPPRHLTIGQLTKLMLAFRSGQYAPTFQHRLLHGQTHELSITDEEAAELFPYFNLEGPKPFVPMK